DGVLDVPKSGVLDVPKSGVLDVPKSGVLDVPKSGVLDVPKSGVLDVSWADALLEVRTELTEYGFVVEKIIRQLNGFYENISIDNYVIMPNHIHLILLVSQDGQSGTPVPTRQNSIVSRFISTFKRFCNKEIGDNIFQRSFYDHVIWDKEDYQNHVRYIAENPMKWKYDELYNTDSLT
ncbi:MAG: transposase, partial [Clostridia bacterium]|nr:transposase [Clostridia bacterium]